MVYTRFSAISFADTPTSSQFKRSTRSDESRFKSSTRSPTSLQTIFVCGLATATSGEAADCLQKIGYKKGDVVAIFMENSIEFVACWLGLAKLGVVTAWVNSSLKMEQLAHCIRTSNTTAVVTSRSLARGARFCPHLRCGALSSSVLLATQKAGHSLATSPAAESSLRFFVVDLGGEDNDEAAPELRASPCSDLSAELADEAASEPTPTQGVDFCSVLCYIYTSGTTGLPKAAVIKHVRYYSMAVGSALSFDIRPTDRIYM